METPEAPAGERWAADPAKDHWPEEQSAGAYETDEPELGDAPLASRAESHDSAVAPAGGPIDIADGHDPVALPSVPAPVEPETEATPVAPPAALPPQPGSDLAAIFLEIETLGDGPELGLLREMLGVEADGLFGFSTMYPGALIALLSSRFAGLGEPENLTTWKAWDHHYIGEKRYGFSWRSEIRAGQMDDAAVLAHESARLIRLRDALIVNLTENRRLFVYAGTATDDQIADIRAAMRTYGRNILLHVVIADAHNAPGEVSWWQDDLLRGYLRAYGTNDMQDIARDDWVAICRAAHQRWRHFTRR